MHTAPGESSAAGLPGCQGSCRACAPSHEGARPIAPPTRRHDSLPACPARNRAAAATVHDLTVLSSRHAAASDVQGAAAGERHASAAGDGSGGDNGPTVLPAVRPKRSTKLSRQLDKHLRSLPGDTVHILYTSNGSPYQNMQGRLMWVPCLRVFAPAPGLPPSQPRRSALA